MSRSEPGDLAVHPELAGISGSGQRRARGAEHRALAQRINTDLVTFGQSTHLPMIEEADKFNTLLRDTWRQARDE